MFVIDIKVIRILKNCKFCLSLKQFVYSFSMFLSLFQASREGSEKMLLSRLDKQLSKYMGLHEQSIHKKLLLVIENSITFVVS